MKTLVSDGKTITVTAPYQVNSGVGCLVGSLFGVTQDAAANAATVVLALTGIYTLAKATGAAWTVGALVYWDNTNKVCTTTASTNKLIGVAASAQASGDTTGQVRLNGAFVG